MESVKLATLAVSLGGIETLIQHPASMTHAAMDRESRIVAGITDGLVRLAVGCEDGYELLEDVRQALDGCTRSASTPPADDGAETATPPQEVGAGD